MSSSTTYNVRTACGLLGFSRQAYYRPVRPEPEVDPATVAMIDQQARQQRKGCPTRGCRTMYDNFGEQLSIGRDKTIGVLQDLGYRVRHPKHYGRSTQAGTRPYANLLVDKKVNGINQVWQADMAHYLYGDRKYYTMYITDVYSQEVVGYGTYSSAHAVNFAAVLRRAIARCKPYTGSLDGLIHHSDGGKQYESDVYGKVCRRNHILQSMCKYSYENPYAEKTNDLINNRYLNIWRPKGLEAIRKCQHKAVQDHNQMNRKKALGKLPPVEFRVRLLNQTLPAEPHVLELKPKNPEQVRVR